MTTSSSALGLTLYNNTTDQSGSFITWAQNMSGSSNSNMTKIDTFAGNVSGSINNLSGSISGSIANISGSINYISGSINNVSGSIAALNLRFMKLYEFSGAGLFDFNNIPQTYTHLLILGTAAGNYAQHWVDIGLDFNGDANSSNYLSSQWERDKIVASDVEYFSYYLTAQILIGRIPGNLDANYGAPIMAIIPNYSANGGFYKTGMGFAAMGVATTYFTISNQGGVWTQNVPITRIRMFASVDNSVRYSFLAGTKISVYGL